VHPPGPSDLLTDRAARAPTVGRGTRPVNHPQCSRRGNLRCPMGQDGAENTRRLRSTRPSDGACTQQKNALAGGQISRMTSHKNCCGWVRGRGVASHRSPGGLPHANPGAEPDHARAGSVEGLPPGRRVVGLRQIDGMPHHPSAQDRILGPSPGRRTSRSCEKPGEVPRAFLPVNPAASHH
jgi:hypothetical protein